MTEFRLPPFETAILLVKDKMRTEESMIFSLSSLRRIVDAAITPWPYDGTRPRSGQIIEKLISDQTIQHLKLKSPRYPNISRYTFGSFSKLALATCLKPKAYLSHWSAADVHGLTIKSAPTIYVNKEQSPKPLLGHANDDITTHYSAAELEELINAAEAIVSRGRTETPNLMLIRQRTEKTVGKVSANDKGPAAKFC